MIPTRHLRQPNGGGLSVERLHCSGDANRYETRWPFAG
jgi:hypothetical protein